MWYIATEELHTAGNVRANRIDGSLHESPLSLPVGTIFELEDSRAKTKFMKIYPKSEGLIRGIAKNNLYSGRGDANIVIVDGDIGELFKNENSAYTDITQDMLTVSEIENGFMAKPTEAQEYLIERKAEYRRIYTDEEEHIYPEILRKYSTLQEDQMSYLAWAINRNEEYPEPLQMMMKDGYTYVRGSEDGYEIVFGFPEKYVSEDGIVDFRHMPEYDIIDPETLEHYAMTLTDLTPERRDKMCASFERDFREIYESRESINIDVPERKEQIDALSDVPAATGNAPETEQITEQGDNAMADTTVLTTEELMQNEEVAKAVNYVDRDSLTERLAGELGDAFNGLEDDMLYVINGNTGLVLGINDEKIWIYDPETKGALTQSFADEQTRAAAFDAFEKTAIESSEYVVEPDLIEEAKVANTEIQEQCEEDMVADGYRTGAINDQKKFNDLVAEENDKSARNVEENMKAHPGMSRLEARKIELASIHERIDKLHSELDQANIELVQARNQLNLQVPGARQVVDDLDKRKDEIRSELSSLRDSARDAAKQVRNVRIDIPVQAAIQKANAVKVGYEKTVDTFREGVRKMQFDGLLAYAQTVTKVNKLPYRAANYTHAVDEQCLKNIDMKIAKMENSRIRQLVYRIKTDNFSGKITPAEFLKGSRKYEELKTARCVIVDAIGTDKSRLAQFKAKFEEFSEKIEMEAHRLGIENGKAERAASEYTKLKDEVVNVRGFDSMSPLEQRIVKAKAMVDGMRHRKTGRDLVANELRESKKNAR